MTIRHHLAVRCGFVVLALVLLQELLVLLAAPLALPDAAEGHDGSANHDDTNHDCDDSNLSWLRKSIPILFYTLRIVDCLGNLGLLARKRQQDVSPNAFNRPKLTRVRWP
jgi:hypothetical protein